MQNLLTKLDLTEDKLQAKLMCRNLLTPRQLEVMKHIALGNSAKLTGDKLDITQAVAQHHIRCVFKMIGAHNLPHAVSLLGL